MNTLKKSPSSFLRNYIWFLVWPLGAFIAGYINGFSRKYDFFILFLFSGFVGLSLALDGTGLDIYVYMQQFISYEKQSFSDFWLNIYDFLYLQSHFTDIGLYILSFSISRVTIIPEILFLALGLFFGFFYARIVQLVGKNYKKKGLIFK